MSEHTARRIDEAVRALVMTVFDRAYRLLELNRDVLDRTARAVLEQETLEEPAILALTSGLRRPPRGPSATEAASEAKRLEPIRPQATQRR